MSAHRKVVVRLLAVATLALPGATRAEDAPALKVGATVFTELTYTVDPVRREPDGGEVHPSAFDVTRAYVNLTGELGTRIAFRVTPDLRRLATSSRNLGPGGSVSTSVDGSEVYRLKYAYGQVGLDGVAPAGSWVRVGAHQTPYLDFMDSVYRYRFQGTLAAEREGLLSSADFGISTRVALPGGRGDVHAGLYNGETYARAEVDDRKALQVRATFRPFPGHGLMKGLRLTGFHVADRYAGQAPRTRWIASATWEHARVNAGLDAIRARDRATPAAADVRTQGTSLWVVGKTAAGLEALLRRDAFDEKSTNGRQRLLAGVAWWFVRQAPAAAAVMVDVERVTWDSTTRPAETRVAVHWLFQR